MEVQLESKCCPFEMESVVNKADVMSPQAALPHPTAPPVNTPQSASFDKKNNINIFFLNQNLLLFPVYLEFSLKSDFWFCITSIPALVLAEPAGWTRDLVPFIQEPSSLLNKPKKNWLCGKLINFAHFSSSIHCCHTIPQRQDCAQPLLINRGILRPSDPY